MSEQAIYKLIPKVMADIGAVGKDRKNEAQGYKFRGIEDFYNAAHPALVKHGVFCCPEVVEHESQDRVSVNRNGEQKTSIRVFLRVVHRFFAPDGSSVEVTTCGEGIDSSDKATNKAMSAAMKYALIELFAVPTQDVEDADRDDPQAGARPNGHSKVERLENDIPLDEADQHILPPEEQLITAEQSKKLHIRFRDELREELKPQADKLLADWLGTQLYVDAAGNPSSKAIPKALFATVGKSAVQWARSL